MTLSTEVPIGKPPPEAGARTTFQDPTIGSTDEEKTLLGIRQARDRVLAKNHELIDALSAAEDQIAELTYQRDDLAAARDASATENADLRQQISALSECHATAVEAAAASQNNTRPKFEDELLAAVNERDETLEIARTIGSDLDRMRGEFTAAREQHERSAELQKKSLSALAEQLGAAQRARDESRRETAKIAAERDALLKRAIDEKKALTARITTLEFLLAAPAEKPGNPPSEVPPANTVRPAGDAPSPAAPPSILADQEIRDRIRAIHESFRAALAQPTAPERISELENILTALAHASRNCGLDLIHHMTSAAGDFARRLRSTPAKLPLSAPTFAGAIEMLGWLGLRGRTEMLDLTGALIYAVDDDVDNCECLAMAFEKVALQTKYSITPEIATVQIAAHPCELIILDVDLPRMDGFELHSRIRKIPAHAATPVIFLSGHLSTRERLESLDGDNNHFIPKPYNLSELTLRVLTLIVEARLA